MFFLRKKPPAGLPEAVQAYLQTDQPNERCPWREASYRVLDVETSGLNPRSDALLAIGVVAIERGRVILPRHWYSLVRPPEGLLVTADSIRIHGLMRDELAQAPLPEEVLPELLEQLAGHVLVVHVAAIDIAFLNQALQAHYSIKLRGPAIDTARLARTLHFNERYFSSGAAHAGSEPAVALRVLATQAGLPVYAQHNALNDAITTAQLFLAQATRLESQGVQTLRDMIRAGRA